LEIILDLPNKTLDEKIYLLASKILLYFAENRKVLLQVLIFHTFVCKEENNCNGSVVLRIQILYNQLLVGTINTYFKN